MARVQHVCAPLCCCSMVVNCLQEFACNGTVVEHPEYGEVIQLQGDQRQHISQFLKKVGLAREDQLKVCGHCTQSERKLPSIHFEIFFNKQT